MNKYCYLYVISKCNKKCFDCCNEFFMNKYRNFSFNFEILKSLDLSEYDNIFITGGEPGLLDKKDKANIIDYLSNYSNKQIELFTNGTNINDWPEDMLKLVHILDFDNFIPCKNSKYSIVVNKDTDIEKIKKLVLEYRDLEFNIKNSSITPISRNKFEQLIKEIDLGNGLEKNKEITKYNNIKFEKSTKCFELPVNNKEMHKKLSIYKKCTCTWYSCLI